MLAMSTVLRREPPFKTIFGYALVFGEDGRPMHKSWGNSIEFDEAAERMGVDMMRWLYTSARPEDNILFGWHAADAARRRLLVLWNAYAFFVTYARPAGWTPPTGGVPPGAHAAATPMDRWILSRVAGLAAAVEDRLLDVDPVATARLVDTFIEDLSTWYVRLSRRRFSRNDDVADRDAAFSTLHATLSALSRIVAPILPFMADSMYQNLRSEGDGAAPDSVHLTHWPTAELARFADPSLESAMATARRVVDLARTLRGTAGLRVRQPLARLWLALPGADAGPVEQLLTLIADEVNVKHIERIDDESSLVDRRVKPLLPKIGKRLGAAIPAVMAAARGSSSRRARVSMRS